MTSIQLQLVHRSLLRWLWGEPAQRALYGEVVGREEDRLGRLRGEGVDPVVEPEAAEQVGLGRDRGHVLAGAAEGLLRLIANWFSALWD